MLDSMNIYEVNSPNPHPPPIQTKRSPACQTNPFCNNTACNTRLSQSARIAALLKEMTVEEKAQNMVDSAAGVPRLGLPAYEWWQEVQLLVVLITSSLLMFLTGFAWSGFQPGSDLQLNKWFRLQLRH